MSTILLKSSDKEKGETKKKKHRSDGSEIRNGAVDVELEFEERKRKSEKSVEFRGEGIECVVDGVKLRVGTKLRDEVGEKKRKKGKHCGELNYGERVIDDVGSKSGVSLRGERKSRKSKNVGGEIEGEKEMKMKKDGKKEREGECYNINKGGDYAREKEMKEKKKTKEIEVRKVDGRMIEEVKNIKDLNGGEETTKNGDSSGLRSMMKESRDHWEEGGKKKRKKLSREENDGESGSVKANEEGTYLQKKKQRRDEVADENKYCHSGNGVHEAGRVGTSIEESVGGVKNENSNEVVEGKRLSEKRKKGKTCSLGKAGLTELLSGDSVKKKSGKRDAGDLGSKERHGGLRCKKEDNRRSKQDQGTAISKKSHSDSENTRRDSVNYELREAKEREGIDGHSDSRRCKRVCFSDEVQVFPAYDEQDGEKQLIQGKRFSKEEDKKVKEAVLEYIKVHDLGPNGLEMVLNCKHHPELKGCWTEIGAALPWRPKDSVYRRAHVLYERSETRKWKPEEYDLLRSFHEEHGCEWKKLASLLGKHRHQIKDTWRRIKLPNKNKGRWTQAEYQKLFDLVNMDLRMKAFEEKKTKYGMLRDNIGWEAISERLSTRSGVNCCLKWYEQLASSMVVEKIWDNADDYRLISVLSKLDACCPEEVNWDDLLDHRPGEICRRRWNQMTKHIGEFQEKSFPEQVELLSARYCQIVPDHETEEDLDYPGEQS